MVPADLPSPPVASTSPHHLPDELKSSTKMTSEQQAYHIIDSENDGKVFLTFKSSEAIKLAKVECLDDKVTVCQEDPTDVPPPSHREVAVTKCLLLEGKAIISKENKSSTLWHAPTAEAALTLPTQSPITSVWAMPSHPLKDESELHLPTDSSQHKLSNVISQVLTASINTCLTKKLGVHSLALSKMVDQSGVSLPFHSKLHSTAIAPTIQAKMLLLTQWPDSEIMVNKGPMSMLSSPASVSATASTLAKPSVPISVHFILYPLKDKLLQPVKTKAIVSKGQRRTLLHSRWPSATLSLPKPLPASSQVTLKSLQPTKTKAVVSKEQTKAKSSSPIYEMPELPRPLVPVPPRCSVPSCTLRDECKPLAKAVTV